MDGAIIWMSFGVMVGLTVLVFASLDIAILIRNRRSRRTQTISYVR
ncbi:MAG: hypothetical protein ACRDT6_11880 [Micromonosporaceae bacterium]